MNGHWKKTITEKVIDDYYRILKPYSDKDIIEATFAYMDSGADKFPTPGILKKHIPFRIDETFKDVDFTTDLPPGENPKRAREVLHWLKTKEKAEWMK